GIRDFHVTGVQTCALPISPEYDPHGSYPCVISLHGANSTPDAQIEWWAGADGPNGQRVGQASRHGYIIIAPAWAKPHQKEFESRSEERRAGKERRTTGRRQ